MANTLIKIGIPAVVLLGVLFQIYLKEPIWLGLGIGRVMQPITDFPYTCRKIADPRMQACEDMWFSPSTRQLFLACSDPLVRKEWFPHMGNFNISGRSQRDSIVALDIDKPVDGGFELRSLKTPGFSGTSGDGLLDLAGFTGMESSDGTVELFLVNMRPSVDAEGNLVDQTVAGGNTTIEHFVTSAGEAEMKHVRTYADQGITSPNRVAVLDDKTFYITNDHGPHKVGWRHHMCMILGDANINFCSPEGCKEVSSNFKFPNGLARKDDILYVPDSMTGRLYIYRILPNKDLQKIDEVNLGYSLDNASIDQNGDIWLAAFPVGFAVLKAHQDPLGAKVPAAVLRVRKTEEGYVVDKIIEDQGDLLPVTTTVVHDAKTGRLFFSSVVSPYIAVCEPKA